MNTPKSLPVLSRGKIYGSFDASRSTQNMLAAILARLRKSCCNDNTLDDTGAEI